jgi:regulator of protease activity HflC (stomatin/prohibitin superfamily)
VKHMPAALATLLSILTLTMLSGCTVVSPDAGVQAVLVKKPLLFGHGGVDPEPVHTGLTIAAMTTDKVYVNMQPQQAEVVFNDLMSSDGVPLSFDAIIRMQVTDAVKLIKNFGPDWYKNNIEREFSNLVRQAVRKHGMNETAISTTAIDAIDKEVFDGLQAYLIKSQIPVNLINVTVGKANPPDAIKSQRIETAKEQQRILTEQNRKLAEDSRKSAELSRAEADNAYRNAMGLSPNQFLQLESIKMQQDVCGHQGHANCTFISNGGNVTPILDTRR